MVEFPGPEFRGAPVTLTGFYTRPDGPGPHPAVVLMPSGSGTWSNDARWAEHLNAWGFAALRVESLTPRGFDDMFERYEGGVWFDDLAKDLEIAIDWLRSRPGIDRDRIHVAGWSAGAGAVLMRLPHLDAGRVAGAIAVYPPCEWIEIDSDAVPVPLLLVLAGKDALAVPTHCSRRYAEQVAAGAVERVEYPEADHLFDAEGEPQHRPADAEDARRRVRRFLDARRRPPPPGEAGEGAEPGRAAP